ncbi:hypothetical protein NQ318_000641 [Aromia moschata]|uniref:Odorant receptor n=1 Tax=Aromia moschata TaxID=1265417 RepID=A0AAV8X8W4_9CUCU|nr:hypothetical protein NQ318_000641 [Aromia moschata]
MESHVHLKFAKILLVAIGVWPVKLSGCKLHIYNAYFYVTFAGFILYNVSQAVMVIVVRRSFLETANNMNVTITYLVIVYKVLICKSTAIKDILEEIEGREMLILQGSDEEVKKIYHKHVKSATRSIAFYVAIGTTSISLYFIAPIVKNYLESKADPSFKNKYLIFSGWLPLDPEEHYATIYSVQFFNGYYGYGYIVYLGAFFFCILKFIVGQIQILQHTLKNFNDYHLRYAKEGRLGTECTQEVFTKLCIREHQYLIGYVCM